jgi:DNA-binding phage protein
MADQPRMVHSCRCLCCQQWPGSDLAQDHSAINRVLASLNEKGRRLFVGLLARQRGHGGVVELATITGMSRTTIRRGLLDLQRTPLAVTDRVRRAGGGRKRVEKKSPA